MRRAPHFDTERGGGIQGWHHALPEATGLASACFVLVSAFLLLHEMPQPTCRLILREASRLLKPGGSVTVMNMNPACGSYQTMPAPIMSLLKSTEPYLVDYFALDLE
jgi:ubiquinone/menaquinone biosynthesis C-methylase UbiE